MKRRAFLGSIMAATAAPFVATGEAPPDSVRFSHVAYGGDGPGPCVEWRGYLWWIGERGCLRWALPLSDANRPEYDWIELPDLSILTLAPHRDRLWLLTRAGWYYFTFAMEPSDDTARIVFAFAS